ncbi:MAG TPA: hypothetical protein VGA56_01245 [Opitutaceae bacterium]|jgi:hypothetical protein
MIHERDVREKLASVLLGEVSLGAFERWLASERWNMFVDSDDSAIEFVAAVNLLVSEHHDNIISEDEFNSELLALLNNIRVSSRVAASRYLASGQKGWELQLA